MGARMHSYPIYQDYQKRAEPLAEVSAAGWSRPRSASTTRPSALDAEMVSGNYFSMLGVQPAAGRVFNSQEDDQVYQGPSRSSCSATTTGSRRFARDPAVVGKKILVNNYPMTIVGVSAAGICRASIRRASPQIRVPILMKPVDRARVGLGAHGRPAHALGAGVRAAEARLHGRNRRRRRCRGCSRRSAQHEMTLPGAKDWSHVHRASSS